MKTLEQLEERKAELEKEIKNFEINQDNYEDQYIEALNEQGEIKIGYLTFSPADIVKELDPTAYRCGLNDYIDGISVEDDSEYMELVEELESVNDEIEEREEEEVEK